MVWSVLLWSGLSAGQVAVLPFTSPDPAVAARLQRFLQEELTAQGETVIRAPQPAASNPTEADLRRALQRAGGNPAALRRAAFLALEHPAAAPYPEIVEALLASGIGELRAGDERAARVVFAEAVRRAPRARLPARMPGAVRREFDRVKKKVLNGPMATLRIEGPAGSVAFLDGRKVGRVPVRVRGVPQGNHGLVLVRAGERVGVTLRIEGREHLARLDFTPSQAHHAVTVEVSEDGLSEEAAERLREHARSRKARQLVAGRLELVGLSVRARAYVVAVDEPQVRALPEVEGEMDERGLAGIALRLAEAMQSPDVPLESSDPPGSPEAAFEQPPAQAPSDAPQAPSPLSQPPGGTSLPAAATRPLPAPPGAPPVVVPVWVYVAGGALVAGLAVTAGVVYLHRPVTGTVTVSW